MSETVSLEFIAATLRAIQAEQRTLRGENELIRKEIGRMATRDELLEVLRVLADRIGNFEALMEARFDQLFARFGLPQSAFARTMHRPGDPREPLTILRSVANWARGVTAPPGVFVLSSDCSRRPADLNARMANGTWTSERPDMG